MSKKIDSDKTHGQKLISLFAKLLFSRRMHSLTELSQSLSCSKQTVQRLVDQIQSAYGIIIDEEIKEKRKYFGIKIVSTKIPLLPITDSEYHALEMCLAFTEHIMGRKLIDEALQALSKSQVLLRDGQAIFSQHFASIVLGNIDYSPQHEIICTLIKSMDKKKVCKVTYKGIMAKKAKTFYIKPLKIFSHKDTIYLHASMARYPDKEYKEPKFDPLLAIHRIKMLEITDRTFEFPVNYNFEKTFNKNFGVIKEKNFEVIIEFSGFAAHYVSERIWNQDQRILKKKERKVELTFMAASEPELISWILSFGSEAKVIEPDWLVKEVSEIIKAMMSIYH